MSNSRKAGAIFLVSIVAGLLHAADRERSCVNPLTDPSARIEYSQAAGTLYLQRGENDKKVLFLRTDRNYELVRKVYDLNDEEFAAELRGRVLDAGSGGSAFVNSLLARGVDAFGIDLVLSKSQLSDPKHFAKQDMAHLEFANESFDTVISTYSALTYESVFFRFSFDRDDRIGPKSLTVKILREFARVLRPSGHALIAPVALSDEFDEALKYVPELTVDRKVRTEEQTKLAYILKKRPSVSK